MYVRVNIFVCNTLVMLYMCVHPMIKDKNFVSNTIVMLYVHVCVQ